MVWLRLQTEQTDSFNNLIPASTKPNINQIKSGKRTHSLVDRVGASLGLYSSYRGGRGGHPLTVPQYVKDHLKSIISLPPDWPGNDTTQMILCVLAHLLSRLMKYSPKATSVFSSRIQQCTAEEENHPKLPSFLGSVRNDN